MICATTDNGVCVSCLRLTSASRVLFQALVKSITEAVVGQTAGPVSDKALQGGTRMLTLSLVPGLTHSLGASITNAMTHSPKGDYYCHYCHSYQVYCDLCEASKQHDYYNDYYRFVCWVRNQYDASKRLLNGKGPS